MASLAYLQMAALLWGVTKTRERPTDVSLILFLSFMVKPRSCIGIHRYRITR
jgi:hypothetical protein